MRFTKSATRREGNRKMEEALAQNNTTPPIPNSEREVHPNAIQKESSSAEIRILSFDISFIIQEMCKVNHEQKVIPDHIQNLFQEKKYNGIPLELYRLLFDLPSLFDHDI